MTVSSSTTKVSYSGDNSTTVFAYTFKIFADADLTVIVRTDATGAESTKTLTTDYTVSGAGNAGGGAVTMVTAPASGETLVIKRSLTLTQSTDYVANDPFPAAAHEDALDRLTFIAQQQQEVFDRAVVFPETDTASTTIPDSVTRANKFLGFGASGEITTLASTGTAPGAIDTGALVDDAVTQAKIADNAVGTSQIEDDAVTQAKIADDAVGQAQIADDAVGSAQIADNAVALATQTTGNYVADITGGNAITTSGGGSENATVTVNHADTSSQASVNNSGNTVIQDVTLDTYGHVTGLTSTTISTTTLPVSYYAIGDYTIAGVFSNGTQSTAAGSTRAGSDLQSVHFKANDGNLGSVSFETAAAKRAGGITSGTWRNNSSASVAGESIVIWVRTA
jgi:hypothetical protein